MVKCYKKRSMTSTTKIRRKYFTRIIYLISLKCLELWAFWPRSLARLS
jgi:hypothetical protein